MCIRDSSPASRVSSTSAAATSRAVIVCIVCAETDKNVSTETSASALPYNAGPSARPASTLKRYAPTLAANDPINKLMLPRNNLDAGSRSLIKARNWPPQPLDSRVACRLARSGGNATR